MILPKVARSVVTKAGTGAGVAKQKKLSSQTCWCCGQPDWPVYTRQMRALLVPPATAAPVGGTGHLDIEPLVTYSGLLGR